MRRRVREDAEGLLAAVQSSRPTLLPWLAWARTTHRTIDNTVDMIAGSERRWHDPAVLDWGLGIHDRRTGRVLGGTGIHRVDPDIGRGEIGYWIRPSMAGRGLITEVARALLDVGLRPQAEGGFGLSSIFMSTEVGNRASQRVCEKLGMPQVDVDVSAWHPCSGRALLTYLVTADRWRRLRATGDTGAR